MKLPGHCACRKRNGSGHLPCASRAEDPCRASGRHLQGTTTPTEAAAGAALYALLISAILYRSVTWCSLYASLAASAPTTSSIGMLIAGAIVYNYVVTVENIPGSLSTWLGGFDLSPVVFLLVVNLILLVLGCLLEGKTILLVIVQVLIPTANALGIDLAHFGIVCVVNITLLPDIALWLPLQFGDDG